MIGKAKFTYPTLGKTLEKQIKTIEDQGKKQIKAIQRHGKQLVESNKIVKKYFNIDRDRVPLEEQKNQTFNELVEEKSYEFQDLKEKINSNNLI